MDTFSFVALQIQNNYSDLEKKNIQFGLIKVFLYIIFKALIENCFGKTLSN